MVQGMKSINMGDDKKEKIMIVHGEHKDDVWLLGTSVKDMGRSLWLSKILPLDLRNFGIKVL